MKRFFISFLTIFTLLLSLSCEKFLDVESNRLVNEENKWQDLNDVRGSLLGVYGLLRTALAENNAHWTYGELRSGDFTALNRRDIQDVIEGNLNSSFELIKEASDWRKFYAVINAANLFIERSGEVVQHDPQYTQINNDLDIAQMRVVKGFVYYLLARTWGDVPIWERSYEGSFPQVEASPVESVLSYAENEILAVRDILPYRYGFVSDPIFPADTYLGFDHNRWNGVLFNRLSAYAILAHINAWAGNYYEAANYSNFVIANAGRAALMANTMASIVNTTNTGFFFGNRTAHLIGFPFNWGTNEGTADGHIEYWTLATPLVARPNPDIYITVDRIVSIFDEEGDERFHFNTSGDVITTYFSDFGGIRPVFRKIHMIRGGESGADGSLPLFTSTLVFTRYEEINLLRAEAYAVLGQTDLALAIVNQMRQNRGLSELPAGQDVVDAIFDERRKELMGEGWRWFDLVRYNRIKQDDVAFNELIESNGIYWPVSSKVLINNNQLSQNPYWN